MLQPYKVGLIIKMEEKQTIQVELFNEPRVINREDFLDFHQLINKQHFAQLKIPFSSLNDLKVHVLNIFVYYIITIEKGFRPFDDDFYGDKYKSLCTKEISNYYIKNKFVIQQYQFSFLSSKALGIKLQESAHIIYYLVYGRFASHPYINTMCGKKDYDFRKNVFRKGKEVIQNLKILKKRTLNNDKSHTDLQLQNFKKDLKNTLRSQQTHLIWKKEPFNTPKQTRNSQQQANLNHITERKSFNRSHFHSLIPQRIAQTQNSSIFQALPFQRNSQQTYMDCNRKGLMRKQKFHQFFQINQYKMRNKQKKAPSSYFEEIKQNNPRKLLFPNDSDQNGRINYESFKKISNDLKTKNTALDKIRTQCSIRNQKLNQHKKNIQNQIQNSVKLTQQIKGAQLDVNIIKFQHDDQEDSLDRIQLRRNFTSIDGNYQNELILGRNFSYAPQRNLSFVSTEEQKEKAGDFTINLLRNDEIGKEKENQEGKKLDYFSQSSVSFKKMNCKHKLQRYKSDYRKFLKTQLLDRIKQAN